MAIDTRQKRASAVSTLTFSRVPGVDNTSLDAAQRQSSIWSYSGILAGAAVAVIEGGIYIPIPRRRRR